MGSTVADLYHGDDVELIQELGRLLAPQIEAYVLASQMHVLRKQLGALRAGPAHRVRIADMLATTAKLADATRRLGEEIRAMVPCDRLVIAVRMMEGDRVVLLEPGETRHLADLPLVPVAGTALGPGAPARAGRRRNRDAEADGADRAAAGGWADGGGAGAHRARLRRHRPRRRDAAPAARRHRGAARGARAAPGADACSRGARLEADRLP